MKNTIQTNKTTVQIIPKNLVVFDRSFKGGFLFGANPLSDIESTNYSETAASNNATPPNGGPEGMAPSQVNDWGREVMAATKREWNRSHPTVTSGGSANTQTLTYTTAPAAYVQGHRFSFIIGFTNTGPTTLNVNSLGTKNVFADSRALAGGELQAGMIADAAYDGTQIQILSTRPLISAPYGFKNVIINGDFQVQQRGAGGALSTAVPASTVAYTFDRWVLTTNANQASNVSATNGVGVSSAAAWAAVVQRNSGQTGTGTMTFQAPLTTDQLAAIRGKIVTLSFRVNFGATFITNNSGGLTCALYMGVGTEGKRGAGFSTETSTCSITTTVVATTAPLAATSAAVVPTTTTQGCVLFSWTPTATAGATDQVILTDVQLEVGGIATSFDRRPFDVELARCQRFFWKNFTYATAPAQNLGISAGRVDFSQTVGAAAIQVGNSVALPTRMRTTPTVTGFNVSATNALVRNVSTAADTTVNTLSATDTQIIVDFTSAAGSAAGNRNSIGLTADADL